MKILQKFLFVLVVPVLLSACIQPVDPDLGWQPNGPGGPDGPGAPSDYDDFWAVSQRNVYNLGDYFDRNSDLLAFALSNGSVIPISVDNVTIDIIINPDSSALYEMVPVSANTYRLSTNVGSGRKIIVVSYEDKTAEYSIEVMDPHNLDPGNGGGGSGGGSGIGIIWS